jgi:hypothetical protein
MRKKKNNFDILNVITYLEKILIIKITHYENFKKRKKKRRRKKRSNIESQTDGI